MKIRFKKPKKYKTNKKNLEIELQKKSIDKEIKIEAQKKLLEKLNIQFEVVPKGKGKILVLVLTDSGGVIFKWISPRTTTFRINQNTYFAEKSGVYVSKNNVLVSIYVEGCSLPINHSLLHTEMEQRTYLDPITKQEVSIDVPIIAELKFDSRIVDICLNRGLADEFTKPVKDVRGVVTLILLCICVIVGLVNAGLLLS